MLESNQIISVPYIPWLTEQILRGMGVKNLVLEITPEVAKILECMPGFNFENYVSTRTKEHISAYIFVILMMQENNKEVITISTTRVIQDIMNWQDVRLRWLYGNPELVYADMTGNPNSYEKKKKWAISGNENKIYIYVPHNLTEYCYKWLQRNEINNTPWEAIRILIDEYREKMNTDDVIKIKTYDLRESHEEKTYLFSR